MFHIEESGFIEIKSAKKAILQAQKSVRFWLSFNLKQFL